MVLLLAHHQLLCYCSLAQPEAHKRSKSLFSQDYSYQIVLWTKIWWQKLVLNLLWSSSVHSILGLSLTTLATTFLDGSKCGPHAWYCSYSSGTPSFDHDIMAIGKKERWQHWTCSYSLCGEVRALDTQYLAQQHQLHELAIIVWIHCSILYSSPVIRDIPTLCLPFTKLMLCTMRKWWSVDTRLVYQVFRNQLECKSEKVKLYELLFTLSGSAGGKVSQVMELWKLPVCHNGATAGWWIQTDLRTQEWLLVK